MSDCRHNTPDRGPEEGVVQTQRQQLDEQTREKLVDRLVDCLYSADGDPDIEALDRCLEELDAAGVGGETFDVEQSLKDFHERFGAAFESSTDPVRKPTRRLRPLARIAIIAAILCAFMLTAQASGLDILGAIARWTGEQFSFVKMGEQKDPLQEVGPYESLQDTLEKLGISEQLAPTRFPEGTEFSEIRVREEETGVTIFAEYKLGAKSFFITIRKAVEVPNMEIEINDPNVEVYVSGEIEYHLMADVKQRKVSWFNNGWECRISGDLSRSDMLLMIDSIYEGG